MFAGCFVRLCCWLRNTLFRICLLRNTLFSCFPFLNLLILVEPSNLAPPLFLGQAAVFLFLGQAAVYRQLICNAQPTALFSLDSLPFMLIMKFSVHIVQIQSLHNFLYCSLWQGLLHLFVLVVIIVYVNTYYIINVRPWIILGSKSRSLNNK